jgi:hypothetical protein
MMRTCRILVAFLLIVATSLLNGCCRKWCGWGWGRRPYYDCEPQVVAPCAPCTPYVSGAPQTLSPGYETSN